jgi:hypothetical protein
MNYEEKHKYDLSKGWRDNLIEFSITSQNLIYGKNVNGFIRRIVIEQDLHRILRLEATGNLVKIPKKDREYPRI